MSAKRSVIAVLALVLSAGLSSCGSGGNPSGENGKALPTVVASTDVWGSVAESVAGDDAKVTSIITSGAADPHSFEASPADVAALTDASLVVYNGGGYDQWVSLVLANHAEIPTVDAYALLDRESIGEQRPNEHVFYDIDTAKAVAGRIAEELAAKNPDKAAEYRSRAEEFARRADTLQLKERAAGAGQPGTAVVATEPVAHYLLTTAGLVDKTPAGFTTAIEQDTDPAAVDVAAMLDLINNREVAVLLYNEQTATEATRKVRAAAEASGVPVVTITETLPAGSDYLTWQSDTTERLAAALRQNP